MRICTLTNAYLPHAGGIEVLLDATCGPLLAAGHEHMIVAGDGGHPPPGPISDDEWLRPTPGVRLERLDVHDAIVGRDLRAIHGLHRRFERLLDEFRPDVVHAHDVGPLLWLYHRAASKRPRLPLIVSIHTMLTRYDEIPEGSARASGHLLRTADVITGVSRDVVEDVTTYSPDSSARVIHLPTGIVPPTIVAAAVDRHRVVTVGRLVPFKRLDRAVEAFDLARRRRPSIRLDLFGEGPLDRSLSSQVAQLGLDDVVHLLGRRPHDEVLAAIASSACLLMSSNFEGLPLVALEAAWAGRPVVAFDAPGVSEAVVHGETGVLVAAGDVAALAAALADLLGDPERADRLGAAARARAERQYTIDSYVDRLVDLYRSTIEATRAAGTTVGGDI